MIHRPMKSYVSMYAEIMQSIIHAPVDTSLSVI